MKVTNPLWAWKNLLLDGILKGEIFHSYGFVVKRRYLQPLMKLMFRINLITGGGRTEDWFVTLRYLTMGTYEEHKAMNGWS